MKLRLLFLISILSLTIVSAQTENRSTSLEGVTEAVLVGGNPALRILTPRNGSSEVRLVKRDGEDTLIFAANKVPNKPGTLVVTKTKVIFNPEGNLAGNYFSYLKSQIKQTELIEKSKLFQPTSLVKLAVVPDDNKFVYMRFPIDSENNKVYAIPGNAFIRRAIDDFDAALAEFKRLTASVRPIDQNPEEAEEEEAEPVISDRYDRFQDITIVSTSKMLVRGSARSIRLSAAYDFAGKTQKKPGAVTLTFIAAAPRPLFREDSLKLNFLVDDQRIPITSVKLADEEKTNTVVRQTVVATISLETFQQLAGGKKVEFQIGALEFKLTDSHLKAFGKLLDYRVRE